MDFNFQNLNLYEIRNYKNKSCCCLIKPNFLTPDKFYFTQDSIIETHKFIEIFHYEDKIKKSTSFNIDFNKNLYLHFSNYNISNEIKYAIPLFESKDFICLSCNKIHNSKSSKCCNMLNSPIFFKEAALNSIFLCSEKNYNQTILQVKNKFLELHFPDVLDKILLI